MATKLDPANVTYAGPTRDQRAEYRTVDGNKLAVWVNPANQESVHASGHFELFDGKDADYQAVVEEAS